MTADRSELKWFIAIAVLAFGVYINSLGGDFVYDDNRQILMNPLIQQPHLFGKALTSDVWAFKGDGSVSASNYYRPVFVLWLIGNFTLFGANPFGWHVVSVLLHAVACLLAFVLTKRLGLPSKIGFVIAAVFAVHPVHVENVAWISGSPDLLLSVFFISSLLMLVRQRGASSKWMFPTALILYGLSLGSKEVAVALLPIYFFIFKSGLGNEPEVERTGLKGPLLRTVPFAVLALAYLTARFVVIGGWTHSVEDAPDLSSALLSIPVVFLFYLRQALFPVFLTENYPLRPEVAPSFGFVVSILAAVVALFLTWRISQGDKVRQFGVLLFILPLLPALFIKAFPSEQIVHDRYLYLPLLGLLIVLGSVVLKNMPAGRDYQRLAGLAVGSTLYLLIIQTVSYSRVWSNSFALWEHNAKADPTSAVNFANYASELSAMGKYDNAIRSYDRSLEIKETPLARMGRARNLIALKRYDEAIADTARIVNLPNEEANAYTLFQGYETAAIAYSASGRYDDAERTMREARERLPIYRAALTDKLAIILYNQGKKDEALRELNSVREQASRELLPASKAVFFRAGMLEAELGDVAGAKRDLNDFMKKSETFSDAASIDLRRQAALMLARLR